MNIQRSGSHPSQKAPAEHRLRGPTDRDRLHERCRRLRGAARLLPRAPRVRHV